MQSKATTNFPIRGKRPVQLPTTGRRPPRRAAAASHGQQFRLLVLVLKENEDKLIHKASSDTWSNHKKNNPQYHSRLPIHQRSANLLTPALPRSIRSRSPPANQHKPSTARGSRKAPSSSTPKCRSTSRCRSTPKGAVQHPKGRSTTSNRFTHTQHSPGLHAHRPPEHTQHTRT